MLLAQLAETWSAVVATRSRTQKITLIAAALVAAGDDERRLVAYYLAGQVAQARLDIGWAGVAKLAEQRDRWGREPGDDVQNLQVADVDTALQAVADAGGAGSQGIRTAVLARLFNRADQPERDFLRALIPGELRQGALEGVVIAAIAEASGHNLETVRRTTMLTGDIGVTAELAMDTDASALAAVQLEVFRPVKPMLAATAASPASKCL